MGIVFFDVDGVLVKGQTQRFLITYLLRKRKIPFSLFIKINYWFSLYKLGLVKDVFKIRKIAFKYFKEQSVTEIEELFRDFFEKEIKPRINVQAVNFVKEHIERGDKVILVSASLKQIVERIKEYLGLDSMISTELEIRHNKYTGNIKGLVPYGKYKIRMIQDFLGEKAHNFSNSWAYTDHISDLQLLKLVDNPCVVNPDRRLKKVAKEKGWKIYNFNLD